jgi:hypothetical protein
MLAGQTYVERSRWAAVGIAHINARRSPTQVATRSCEVVRINGRHDVVLVASESSHPSADSSCYDPAGLWAGVVVHGLRLRCPR